MDPLAIVALLAAPFVIVWSIRRQIRQDRERRARTIYVVHSGQGRRSRSSGRRLPRFRRPR